MRNKLKIFIVCLLLTVTVFVEPVSYAFAGDLNDNSEVIPKMDLPKVEYTIKEFFDWFGLVNVPEENIFKEFAFSHRKIDNIDYTLYDLVCDFELKTMDDVGYVITSTYSYTIDFKYSDVSWSGDRISLDDSLVYNHCDKSDGSDWFIHEFVYKNVVKNAKGFREYPMTGWYKNYKTCNTVISQVDFYFVRKSDNEAGAITRFKFTWDSDFKKQICKKIDSFYVDQNSEDELETGSVESDSGVYVSSDEDDTFGFADIMWLLYDIPASLVAIVIGFVGLVMKLSDLFHAVFPFIPGMVFDIFAIFMLLLFLVFAWKLVFKK